jgi:GNAT superfamily N-acetyltransferase
MRPHVRLASESDREAVLALDPRVLANARRAQEVSDAIRDSMCLVAELDSRVAGFVLHSRSFFGQTFISLVFVDQASRRRGAGSALIRAVERTGDTDKIFTSTNESNKVMQNVLKSLGFVASGIIENLDVGDPELVYFKKRHSEDGA